MHPIRRMPLLCLLTVALILASCARNSAPPTAVPLPPAAPVPLTDADLNADAARAYRTQVDYTPNDATYFDLINGKLPLADAELTLLEQQGFVLSERWTWQRFVEAYAWIYWQDLPVLVTTDSLLHTVHQSYDDLLKDLEQAILIPQLRTILTSTAAQVAAQSGANTDLALVPLYADVAIYLQTAVALLDGEPGQTATVTAYVDLATAASSYRDVTLFGGPRTVDFSLFKPRGHYAGVTALEIYFRAMTWLAQVDFRFIEYDPLTSEPLVNPSQIVAAVVLHNALDAAAQRQAWANFNGLFEVLVGRSDNMALPDLDRFLTDLALTVPADVLAVDPATLLTQLTEHDYGQQRITGQLLYRHVDNTSAEPIGRPVSFLFMGQRFAIDSYITGNVVYDRVLVDDEPVLRPLPSPLDIAYALGNDRAATHLTAELATYPYGGALAGLRQQVDGLSPDFWAGSFYNRWLGLIRTLNTATLGADYPQSMQTAAWADKMLQTQLAAWTQLRHDNILYVKQSFTTAMIACEYPAGYVEPYPAFYQQLNELATGSAAAVRALDVAAQGDYAQSVKERALTYFTALESISAQLQTLAEKELRLAEFTPTEELFLRSIVKLKENLQIAGCGGPTFEDQWDGWYMNLFYSRDDNPSLIA
ncbi:MAG: DUF3160 domain-containing protein, partial [Caldilineaceae bacterium]|nr:DUF3160 domain-containing protein [Caldilineaceae bacterium]